MSEYEGSSLYMDTRRLETLVDGIFAIAMTLLVLGLAVPQINAPLSNMAVQTALYNLLPNFISLVISFLLLAIFWKIHHRIFKLIKMMNGTLLWINVIWLLFIVLVPFSASLTGDYGQFPISNVIFNVNMLDIASILYLNWHYATRSNFIHEKVDDSQITFTKRINPFFRYSCSFSNISFIYNSSMVFDSLLIHHTIRNDTKKVVSSLKKWITLLKLEDRQ